MNTMAPVSVVIPCYCCCETIERAVKSVAAQTQRPAEVFLVDDASTDATFEVLKKLSQEYPGWLQVVKLPENQGVGNARNVGWSLATQPYIAFLDADDAWHPEKIALHYRFMETNPDVVLSGHDHRELPQEVQPDWSIGAWHSQPIAKAALLLSNRFVTPSVMVRRAIPLRFVKNQRHMEDHMLWITIVSAGYLVKRLDVALVAIYKPIYGASGLSAHLWLMQRAELGNYAHLFESGQIPIHQFIPLVIYSSIKYMRRLIVYYFYLRWI